MFTGVRDFHRLERPTTGSVRLTGWDVSTMSDRELAGLHPDRVRVPAVLPRRARYLARERRRRPPLRRRPAPRRRQAALDALEAVNLAGRASARPTQRLLDSRPAARALSLAITHSLEPAGVVGPPDP